MKLIFVDYFRLGKLKFTIVRRVRALAREDICYLKIFQIHLNWEQAKMKHMDCFTQKRNTANTFFDSNTNGVQKLPIILINGN